MYVSYQYGGKSDDLGYLEEVLRTAERLGDTGYIARIKAQIEEIKKIRGGAKGDPRRKRGDICKPGLPTMDPMSCRGDFMAKCIKDPKDSTFKCCSTVNGVVNCGEPTQKPEPTSKQVVPVKTVVKEPVKAVVKEPVKQSAKELSVSDKAMLDEYFGLKRSIIGKIEELRKLKVKKDQLIQFKGKTPSLVYHSEQNNSDDCIRDEGGKVLRC